MAMKPRLTPVPRSSFPFPFIVLHPSHHSRPRHDHFSISKVTSLPIHYYSS